MGCLISRFVWKVAYIVTQMSALVFFQHYMAGVMHIDQAPSIMLNCKWSNKCMAIPRFLVFKGERKLFERITYIMNEYKILVNRDGHFQIYIRNLVNNSVVFGRKHIANGNT